MPGRVKVVYIASMGHSGSTLLDLMLAAHSRVFSVGEVYYIHDYTSGKRQKDEIHHFGPECTCGAPNIWECPFWTEVDRVMQRETELRLADIELRSEDDETFIRHNQVLFECVRKVSGQDVIVDSSKTPRRLWRLLRSNVFDLVPVHLVRHPRGSIWSHQRRHKRLQNLPSAIRLSARFAGHVVTTRAMLRRHNRVQVRYERLIEETEPTLRRIMEAAGLEFEPRQLEWAGHERHNLGGNPMRRTTSSTLRLDTSWKGAQPWYREAAIDLITLPPLIGFGRG